MSTYIKKLKRAGIVTIYSSPLSCQFLHPRLVSVGLGSKEGADGPQNEIL